MKKIMKQLVPWIVPFMLLISWQVLSSVGFISSRILPNPVDIVKAAM
jgi:sulfonate transport system permease protein